MYSALILTPGFFSSNSRQGFQSCFVTTRAAPPTEAQDLGIGLCIRRADERDGRKCSAKRYHLSAIDHGDPTMIHVQTLSRIHSNLGEGMGVLEQLVFGDHEPTGLVGPFAGFGR